MKAIERRQAMLELLCERRHEKIENIAFEFGVSRKTVMHDVSSIVIKKAKSASKEIFLFRFCSVLYCWN